MMSRIGRMVLLCSLAGVGMTVLASEPVPFELAPPSTKRIPLSSSEKNVYTKPIATWYADHPGQRGYIQVDRPLYKPGESIAFRSWELNSRSLGATLDTQTIQLINPRGAVAETRTLSADKPFDHFELPEDAPGGAWILRSVEGAATLFERKIIVRSIQIPKIKTSLELPAEALAPGAKLEALVQVARATGEPLANRSLEVLLSVGGSATSLPAVTTDASGQARISLTIPNTSADLMLTVLVEDGGITESISRPIAVMLPQVRLNLFPEGGQLVGGLESQVYFEATDPKGKPVSVEGVVVDASGQEVGIFESSQDGRGKFKLEPVAGQRYRAIVKGRGADQSFNVPPAAAVGCVLNTFDDTEGYHQAVRVSVRCSAERVVTVVGMQQEQLLDLARVQAGPTTPAIVYLESTDETLKWAPGVARVTVFEGQNPLAERVIFRNRGRLLKVKLTPDREEYQPGEEVELEVATMDRNGVPVASELALSVVDDTLLSYADDSEGGLVARSLLAAEIPGTIDNINHYFDQEDPDSAEALDLLLATRGWRRFEWQPLFGWEAAKKAAAEAEAEARKEAEREAHVGVKYKAAVEIDFEVADMAMPMMELRGEAVGQAAGIGGLGTRGSGMGGGGTAVAMGSLSTPVRVMAAAPEPAREDFRDTLYWNPRVRTDSRGKTSVRFKLSDAVSSFRVQAEGLGGGTVGSGEQLISSQLPLALDIKFPESLMQGDRPLLPVMVSNDTGSPETVALQADWGGLLTASEAINLNLPLDARGRGALYVPLLVSAPMGKGEVRIAGSTSKHQDAFSRSISVTPLGFPQEQAVSGVLAANATSSLALPSFLPGTLTASITLYPSALSTVLAGMEGMLRQPGGCFEQTSSSNYPNVMVLQYLKEAGSTSPELSARAETLLKDGYKRLTGYESKGGGYEWFGAYPAHEALTAYGLLEFFDMKQVFEGVDTAMMDRTASWLIGTRRNGKGGYLRNDRALDSFGRASEEVTDAYVTWSLVEAGYHAKLQPELQAMVKLAQKTDDPYLLALASASLADQAEGKMALEKLLKMQAEDGSWPGANHSITRSGGKNLLIETTALGVLAGLSVGGAEEAVVKGLSFLQSSRDAGGGWGATQATVLSLRAITTYARTHRATPASGSFTVKINGQAAGKLAYQAGQEKPLVLTLPASMLQNGSNALVLEHNGSRAMPFTVAVSYRTEGPLPSSHVAVDLETSLERTSLRVGETTRLLATLKNTTGAGQPMTLARIGIPGGLSVQQWQLDALKESGAIAYYETRPSEVALYWRALAPNAVQQVALDLVATVPGSYSSPASSAYLYYTDESKDWEEGVEVRIER